MRNKRGRKWVDSERDILRELYPTIPCYEIAKRLKRTDNAIRVQAHLLGLKANQAYHIRGNWRLIEGNPYKQLTNMQIGYIAGIFDGEGSISKTSKKYWRMTITNTDKNLIDWLHRIIKFSTIHWRERNTNFSPKELKACCDLTLYGNLKVRALLKVLYPHLIVKKSKVEEVLRDIGMANGLI